MSSIHRIHLQYKPMETDPPLTLKQKVIEYNAFVKVIQNGAAVMESIMKTSTNAKPMQTKDFSYVATPASFQKLEGFVDCVTRYLKTEANKKALETQEKADAIQKSKLLPKLLFKHKHAFQLYYELSEILRKCYDNFMSRHAADMKEYGRKQLADAASQLRQMEKKMETKYILDPVSLMAENDNWIDVFMHTMDTIRPLVEAYAKFQSTVLKWQSQLNFIRNLENVYEIEAMLCFKSVINNDVVLQACVWLQSQQMTIEMLIIVLDYCGQINDILNKSKPFLTQSYPAQYTEISTEIANAQRHFSGWDYDTLFSRAQELSKMHHWLQEIVQS